MGLKGPRGGGRAWLRRNILLDGFRGLQGNQWHNASCGKGKVVRFVGGHRRKAIEEKAKINFEENTYRAKELDEEEKIIFKDLLYKKGYVESYYKYAMEKAAKRLEHRIENYEEKESVNDTLYERLENTPCGFDERTHNINLQIDNVEEE